MSEEKPMMKDGIRQIMDLQAERDTLERMLSEKVKFRKSGAPYAEEAEVIESEMARIKQGERKVLNMIWANEGGVSVYIYEGEHERRVIEIHGVVNDSETVLATATIEKHNRNRVAQALEFPNRTEEFNKRYNLREQDLFELSKAGRIVQSAEPPEKEK